MSTDSVSASSWWTRKRLIVVIGAAAGVIVALSVALIVVLAGRGNGAGAGSGEVPTSKAWHAGNDWAYNAGGSEIVGSTAQFNFCIQGAASYDPTGGQKWTDFRDGCLAFFNP